MPSLGADMDSGTLVEWLVKPGDTVHKGDIVAVVDTSKSSVEVETFQGGVVQELLIPEGTEVPVGTPLATITAAAEEFASASRPKQARATKVKRRKPKPVAPAHSAADLRVSSPLVRRRAAELGIDLESVAGTGRGGFITRTDVERVGHPAAAPTSTTHPATVGRASTRRARVSPYARRLAKELGVDLAPLLDGPAPVGAKQVRRAAQQAETLASAPESTRLRPAVPTSDMRLTIARLMARSKREIPHYYLSTTADLQVAMTWMHEQNLGLPVAERIVPAALLLKATALAARQYPQLNGFWIDDAFVPGPGVHLGVAISLRTGGMVAPALHDAADLDVRDLMVGLRGLVTRARSGRLRGSELADPTLTVTNLGDQGVDTVFGVIYPPQVALVGFGRISSQPVAVAGLLGVHPVTQITLAADHRATDGFTGARFLDTIDTLLQQPEEL